MARVGVVWRNVPTQLRSALLIFKTSTSILQNSYTKYLHLTMAPSNSKKRKLDDGHAGKPKKIRKQQYYSSPSASPSENEDDFPAVNLADSDEDADTDVAFENLPCDLATSCTTSRRRCIFPISFRFRLRLEYLRLPTLQPQQNKTIQAAFQTQRPRRLRIFNVRHIRHKTVDPKRADPVLARSATAAEANASISNTKLETKARHKLRSEKKEALEKGRVKDVLGIESAVTQATLEEEKRLGKIAQRGVLKLFNAVRQAQVRGEEARKAASSIAGRGRREEKVGEMSKIGFLEMVAGGGKGKDIEEG